MSSRRSARQFTNFGETTTSTTSLFVQNHTSPEHLLAQVETLFFRGDLHQTHHLIECIVENNNALVGSADLFVTHAKVFIELYGFNVHAQCSVEQALLLEPEHAEALKLKTLSRLHEEFRDGLYTQAETELRELIKSEPENIYAQYLLAYHLFWKNGAQTEALDLLETSVRQRPSFLRAWLCLAMAYKRGHQSEKAEDAFQECLALDKDPVNLEFYKNHLQSI